MRTLITAIPAALILALSGPVATTAIAAEGPLPAGKPTGIKQAQLVSTPVIVVAGVAAIAAGIAISQSASPVTTAVVATSP